MKKYATATLAAVMAETDAQRKQEGLFALANIAEREGRLAAALALAKWADEIAPFVPYATTPRRSRRGQECGAPILFCNRPAGHDGEHARTTGGAR